MKLINFDYLHTLTTEVGLTLEVEFQWVDPDIDFEDAKSSEEEIDDLKIVSDSEMGKIWLPLNDRTFDNAVITETIKESFYSLCVIIKRKGNERSANIPKESLIQGVHLELRKTNCLLQVVILTYLGQNIRQKFCIYWTF